MAALEVTETGLEASLFAAVVSAAVEKPAGADVSVWFRFIMLTATMVTMVAAAIPPTINRLLVPEADAGGATAPAGA